MIYSLHMSILLLNEKDKIQCLFYRNIFVILVAKDLIVSYLLSRVQFSVRQERTILTKKPTQKNFQFSNRFIYIPDRHTSTKSTPASVPAKSPAMAYQDQSAHAAYSMHSRADNHTCPFRSPW